MKNLYKIILGLALLIPGTVSAAPQDSIIVYNQNKPLIYEDAWDLWPYVFLNTSGEPDGYNIDLLKLIFKELDIPYIIKLKPTLEAQSDLRNKQSDLMLRMDADFARSNSSYGQSIVQLFTHSIVVPKSKNMDIRDVNDLNGHRVIVHEGSFSHHYLLDHKINVQIEAYDDMRDAILKVSTENDGIILWNTMSLKWLIQKYQTDHLQLIPIDLPYGEYKFFSNDHHLLAQMDSVYNVLRANDRLTPIQNKWFYPERKDTGIPDWIWQVIYALAIVAFFFLLYYIIYKVRERKMTKEIRKSNDRLALIMETSHVSFWTYDVESQIFTVMDQHGRPERTYTSLEFSQRYKADGFNKLTNALKQVISEEVPSVSINLLVWEANHEDEPRDFNLTLSVLRRNKQKKPSVIICSRNDITEDLARHRKVKDTMLRYQSIFNSAMIDMVAYDQDGYITEMNQKSLNALGISIETIREMKIHVKEVLGLKDFSVEDMDYIYLTQIYTKEDKRSLNKLLKRDEMYYELQLMPVRGKQNELLGIFGTGRDVTETVHAYHQLKANTRQLQQINNEMTHYVKNIDYVLQVGGISMATYHLDTHTLTIYSEIGNARYALTQTRAISLVAEESKKQALRMLNKMENLATGSLHGEIKSIIRQKGQPLYLEFHFIPLYQQGEIKEYFGMCRDISELKAIETKLAKETVRAQEVEVIKNAFLRNMSYEIRTPLNSVVGFSELFELDHSPEDEAIFIDEIKRSSSSLLKLINDILFLSRLDAGMITITPKPLDFAAICVSRCEAVWNNMKQPGVEYIVRNPYKRMIVEVDDSHLSMVIDKIITNAVQHTTKGMVEVRYDYMGDQLLISVEDTGSGIPKETVEHIFERFVTTANTGAGLGLSICHELIEYMGGKIQLKSEEGKGTTVWITLPCKLIEMERI
jgi:PAS domain S-box-containing protein